MGRFLEPDPIRFLGGVNFYVYVGNNTVNFVDPWGWCKKKNREEMTAEELSEEWKQMTMEEIIEFETETGGAGRMFWQDPVVQVAIIVVMWRPDPPHHGLGPHDHIGPWKTGPKSPGWGKQKWPGWIEWIKKGGGWKSSWN